MTVSPVLLVLLFLTTAAAMFCLLWATMSPSSNIGTRLRTLGRGGDREVRKTTRMERLQEKVLEPLSKAVPRSPDEVGRTRQLLMSAGYREPRHLAIYYGMRVFLAILFPFLGALSTLGLREPYMLGALAILGFILPSFVLKRMIKRRQMVIRLSLPDALDLAVICTEAGLGLDQTINRIADELKYAHKELCEELHLVTLEMRAGKARADALHNLAVRTGVDDLRALVAVLIQTDRFGTSVGQALRVHSDALRTERRQRAEEAAAKTTIKMVPVLIFFVLPSMFIVSLGPAFIQMYRHLMPYIEK